MAKKQIEYIFATNDGDTRIFEDVDSARKFARNNRQNIRGRVERRVWKGDKGFERIDENQTKLFSVEDLLNKDMRKI